MFDSANAVIHVNVDEFFQNWINEKNRDNAIEALIRDTVLYLNDIENPTFGLSIEISERLVDQVIKQNVGQFLAVVTNKNT